MKTFKRFPTTKVKGRKLLPRQPVYPFSIKVKKCVFGVQHKLISHNKHNKQLASKF